MGKAIPIRLSESTHCRLGYLYNYTRRYNMDRLAQGLIQNIKLRNKLNNINHDYETLRRRAVLRRNDRLKRQHKELQAIEKKLLADVGVESYKPTPLIDETNLIALALGLVVGIILGIFL